MYMYGAPVAKYFLQVREDNRRTNNVTGFIFRLRKTMCTVGKYMFTGTIQHHVVIGSDDKRIGC